MRFTTFPAGIDVWVTLVSTAGDRSTTVKTRRLSSGQLHPPAVIGISSRQERPFYCDHVEINEGAGRYKRHRYPLTIQPGDTVTIR